MSVPFKNKIAAFHLVLAFLAGFVLVSCGGGSSGSTSDTTPPTVSSTSPATSTAGIALNAALTAKFNESLAASSVSAATFTLDNGVTGAVTYSGTTATLTPSSNLAYATVYTATLTTGVTDVAGNPLASNYIWTFTTQSTPPADTGITASQCYQSGSDVLVACNSAGALALNTAQDGMVGRDADAPLNSNTDGKLGFNFTSVPAAGSDPGNCVQDNITGLMWEVKTTNGGLRDWNNRYTNYSPTYNPSALYGTATDATGFVTAVNATNLCGFNDWRLPTADELQGIVDYGVVTSPSIPSIDATWLPNTQSNLFWTGSPYAGASLVGWGISFNSGVVDYSLRRFATYAVRLVRAGQPLTPPRYTVSADGQEVTDSKTNLIWRRCAEGMVYSGGTCTGTASTYTHQAALQRAAAQAGSTGVAWRLPNVKELSSIADVNLISPAIDATAFPATALGAFWSASPVVNNATNAWDVTFDTGNVSATSRSTTDYVRLVRAGL